MVGARGWGGLGSARLVRLCPPTHLPPPNPQPHPHPPTHTRHQALFESTIRLVLVPTVAGLVINELFKARVDAVRPALPLLALALTVVLCAGERPTPHVLSVWGGGRGESGRACDCGWLVGWR